MSDDLLTHLRVVNAAVQKFEESAFALSCLNFLAEKGYLTEKQLTCLKNMKHFYDYEDLEDLDFAKLSGDPNEN